MSKLKNIHPGEVLKEEFLAPLGIVEFDKSFEKWLSNISEAIVLKKVEQTILKAENAKAIHKIYLLRKN